jgi:hypothetical protein
MSRIVLHNGKRFTVIIGVDYILKSFAQLYDKYEKNNTPEGEGLVYDWSVAFGTEVNKINLKNTNNSVLTQIRNYVIWQAPEENVDLNLLI